MGVVSTCSENDARLGKKLRDDRNTAAGGSLSAPNVEGGEGDRDPSVQVDVEEEHAESAADECARCALLLDTKIRALVMPHNPHKRTTTTVTPWVASGVKDDH